MFLIAIHTYQLKKQMTRDSLGGSEMDDMLSTERVWNVLWRGMRTIIQMNVKKTKEMIVNFKRNKNRSKIICIILE